MRDKTEETAFYHEQSLHMAASQRLAEMVNSYTTDVVELQTLDDE